MKGLVAVILGVLSIASFLASEWWERGLGTYEDSVDSPDGCLRLDMYRPFWVLPSMFHHIPHPDDGPFDLGVGRLWESPQFYRLHERSTGQLLGESRVFDGVFSMGGLKWGDAKSVGERKVEIAMNPVAVTTRCADAMTLARLEAAYDRGEWKDGSSAIRDSSGNWIGDRSYKLEGASRRLQVGLRQPMPPPDVAVPQDDKRASSSSPEPPR
jgi:hypothetical protein